MKMLALALSGLVCLAVNPFSAVAAEAASRNISVEDAAKLLKEKKDIVVLDVRTPDEFKDGHIPGAKNLDFNGKDFKGEVGKLDKSKTYLVHCAAGGRSARANKVMQDLKFKSVLHLNEGFNGWEEKKQAIEK